LRLRSVLQEKDSIDPDDVIMNPARARERGLIAVLRPRCDRAATSTREQSVGDLTRAPRLDVKYIRLEIMTQKHKSQPTEQYEHDR